MLINIQILLDIWKNSVNAYIFCIKANNSNDSFKGYFKGYEVKMEHM